MYNVHVLNLTNQILAQMAVNDAFRKS